MKKFFSLIAAVLFAGSMMAADLYSIDFTQGQGEWTIDVQFNPDELNPIWAQDANYGMKATAYVNGERHETQALLVSPAIDLSGVEAAKLVFSHALNYGTSAEMAVCAKVADGEWSDLEVSQWPAGNNWTYVDAEADLAAFVGKADVQVAFVYTSTSETAATWEIKTLAISDGGEVTPPAEEGDVIFTGADFAGQGTSSTGSEVSATKDGVTFHCDKGYSDDAHSTLRCYKNGVITITSATEQIGKLAFQFYQTYTGDLENEVVVNAKEWTYTLTNQARIEKLTIYFGEAEPIEPVVIEEITVAQAMEIGSALPETGGYTDKKYAVKGFVVSAKEYGEKYEGKQTFYMSDDATAERGEFTAYNCSVAAPGVVVGDYVKVTGKIQKYVYESGDFVIEITGGEVEPAAQGIENVVLTEDAQKVVVDGVVYVVRDNKMFNLQGAQVR